MSVACFVPACFMHIGCHRAVTAFERMLMALCCLLQPALTCVPALSAAKLGTRLHHS